MVSRTAHFIDEVLPGFFFSFLVLFFAILSFFFSFLVVFISILSHFSVSLLLSLSLLGSGRAGEGGGSE